jgi:small subunit ribosomal protein S5
MEYRKSEKAYDEKVLEIARVSRTVKGGKRISFRALVAVGDRNGKVGVALGKGAEVATAIKKASSRAKKNLKLVSLNENSSIFREITYTFGSSTVLLRPASQGTSIIAGGVVRSVAELAGVKNLVAKLYRSNNKKNTAMATLKALLKSSQNR